jgi:hypothetical protein
MRLIVGPLVAAALMLPAPAVRAQAVDTDSAPAVNGPVVLERAGVAPTLQPARYASYMLPASPSHPWAIVPDFGYTAYGAPGLGYGYRTSPYGEYGRFSYFRTGTGPFPGLYRPFVRFDTGHPHHHD